jgi:hypothetical protein
MNRKTDYCVERRIHSKCACESGVSNFAIFKFTHYEIQSVIYIAKMLFQGGRVLVNNACIIYG